jgi:hypothetical protein
MSDSKKLRDALEVRLIDIVENTEELSPAMVSACVNYLKQFPPHEEAADLPAAKHLSKSLEQYAKVMPFRS